MRALFLALMVTTALSLGTHGCVNEDAAIHALRSQGLTNIHITGYAPFTCSRNDLSSTGFTATNAQGMNVSGTVCCGILKNCTIRW